MTSSGEIRFSHASVEPTRGFNRASASLDNAALRIAETFVSRQGEGKLTGVESFFVRTSGCNLRCWFCDTPYASWKPEGARRSVRSIAEEIADSGVRHVVLTGGEPMLSDASVPLCQELRRRGHHITIETAGTIDRDLPCDLMSISPKLAASSPDPIAHPRLASMHEERRMPFETIRRLIRRGQDFQVKFVLQSASEFEECRSVIASLSVQPQDVWIMPEGTTVESMDQAAVWLRPWSDSQGYQYCDRMQIRWYGNQRGT